MDVLKEMESIHFGIDTSECPILRFAKYENLINSLENCTRKLEELVEKTTEIEEKSNTRKR